MGEIELGTCAICNKENTQVLREYYFYDIKCECCMVTHEGKRVHAEYINHCIDCEPKPPRKIIFEAKPLNK